MTDSLIPQNAIFAVAEHLFRKYDEEYQGGPDLGPSDFYDDARAVCAVIETYLEPYALWDGGTWPEGRRPWFRWLPSPRKDTTR